MNLSSKKGLIYAVVGFVIVFVLGTALFSSGGQKNLAPSEDSDGLLERRVLIAEGAELYSLVNNQTAYDFVTQDLYTFAVEAMGIARPTDKDIAFFISKIKEMPDSSLEVTGEYQQSGDKVRLRLKLLNYGRLSSSIENLANNANIDSRLPSNSKLNAFIGSLPYESKDFSIVYNESANSFTIRILSAAAEASQNAKKHIYSGTGAKQGSLKTLTLPYLDGN